MSGRKKPKALGLLSRGSRVQVTSGALFSGPRKLSLESKLRLFTDQRGPDACWRWLGRFNEDGYGETSHRGRREGVHRLVFALEYGAPVSGAVVRHLCSHAWCVNPRHLRAGTHADNRRDTVIAGRQAKGSKNGRAKLSEEDAREIVRRLKAGHRITYVARDFGVSRRACAFIRDGKNWAHVHARPRQWALLAGAQ